MQSTRTVEDQRPSLPRRLSAFFFRHTWLKLLLLLAPGLVWLVGIYLGSLGALVSFSFRRIEGFTGLLLPGYSLESYGELFDPANRDIILRTAAMAAAVTVACAVVAFPIANYMARYATPRIKTLLFLAVMMPLWSSYLVRVLAWRQILAREGIFVWFVDRLGLGGVLDFLLGVPGVGGESLLQSSLGMFIVFTYIWLPYMILPLEAALERVPESFVEASSDLGARPRLTFRRVVFPLALPGLIAGSIFTFSLTLGDFIVPQVIGDSSFFIGVRVFQAVGVEGNLPLAAAFSVVPMVIMALYLVGAKRMGAFEAL